LEARLVYNGDPRVPKQVFAQILNFCQSNPKNFQVVAVDEDIRDYFFKTSDGQQVRQRCHKRCNEWIQKLRLVDFDYEVVHRPLGFRVSLREESKVNALPNKDDYEFLRIKQRCSFALDCFRIDFSTVWMGKTPEEIKAATPGYEIEVEIVPEAIPRDCSDDKLATLFLCRVLELQGELSKDFKIKARQARHDA
jgi:hypothetical protein